MKTVIHIEDSPEWQIMVRESLLLNTEINPIAAYSSFDEFRRENYPLANLYICDRHLPEKKGRDPNDKTWVEILNTLYCLHPSSPVIMLSSCPPKNWRDYKNVVDIIDKEDFDSNIFRVKVEGVLGLEQGGRL
jgi:hypothetical protein